MIPRSPIAVGPQSRRVLVGLIFLLCACTARGVAQQRVVFKGIPHDALGQATLQRGIGTLTLGNIGSSGKDGVSMDTGPVEGAEWHWQPLPDPSTLPDGTGIHLTAFGNLNGAYSQLGHTGALVQQGRVHVDADFSSIGSPTVRVEFFLGGQYVATAPNQTSGIVLVICDVMPAGCSKGGGRLPHPFPLPYPAPLPIAFPDPWPPVPCYIWIWDTPQVFDSGIGPVTADEVRILTEAPGLELGDVQTMQQTFVDGAAPKGGTFFDITYDIAGVCKWRRRHEGTGQAVLRGDLNGHLVVSNIGSSGVDGVCAKLFPDETGAEFTLTQTVPAQPGQMLAAHAMGMVGGMSMVDLGSLSVLADAAGSLLLTPDCSPIGSSTQTVQLFEQGQLVLEVSSFSGSVQVQTSQWPGT